MSQVCRPPTSILDIDWRETKWCPMNTDQNSYELRQTALKHHQGDIFGVKNQTNSRQRTQLVIKNRTSHTSHEITV